MFYRRPISGNRSGPVVAREGANAVVAREGANAVVAREGVYARVAPRGVLAVSTLVAVALVVGGCGSNRRSGGNNGEDDEDGVGVGLYDGTSGDSLGGGDGQGGDVLVASDPWSVCGGSSPKSDTSCCPSGEAGKDDSCLVVGPGHCASASAVCLPTWCGTSGTYAASGCADDNASPAACFVDAAACGDAAACPAGQSGTGCGATAGQWQKTGTGAATAQLSAAFPVPVDQDPRCPAPTTPVALGAVVAPSVCATVGADTFCADKLSAAPACPAGFVADTGGQCAPDPTDCSTAPWGGAKPPTDALYVSQSAPPGGNGSAAAPFISVLAALDVVKAGQTIWIDKGNYKGQIKPKVNVLLRGKCPAEVTLWHDDPADSVVSVNAVQLTLSGVRLTSAESGVIQSGGQLTLDHVAITQSAKGGLQVYNGGVVNVAHSVVRDVAADSTGKHGRGFWLSDGAKVTLNDVQVAKTRTVGITAADATTTLSLTDVVVRDTLPQPLDSGEGRGVVLYDGASLLARRLTVLGAYGAGIAIYDAKTADLAGVVVENILPEPSTGKEGYGLLGGGGVLTVQGIRVKKASGAGIYAATSTTKLTLVGALIEETQPLDTGKNGQGMRAEGGAQVTASGVHLRNNTEHGLLVSDPGTQFTVTSMVVEGTKARPADNAAGYGVWCGEASCKLTAARVSANLTTGMTAAGAGTVLDLTDVTIDATGSQPSDKSRGFGLQVAEQASVKAKNVRLHGNRTAGMWVSDAHLLSIDGIVIDETKAQEKEGWGGRGLNWLQESTAAMGGPHNIDNAVFYNNTDHQMYLDGAVVSMTNVSMAKIAADYAGNAGHALQIQNGGQLVAKNWRLHDHKTAALLVRGAQSELQLSGGCVTATAKRGADQAYGRALVVEDNASAFVENARFSKHLGTAVSASQALLAGKSGIRGLHLRNVLIDDVQPSGSDDTLGRGIQTNGAAVRLEQVEVVDAAGGGISIADAGGTSAAPVVLRDLVVRHSGNLTPAQGIELQNTGDILLRRVATSGRFAQHLAARGSVTLQASQVALTQPVAGGEGLGLVCAEGARCTIAVGNFRGGFAATAVATGSKTVASLAGIAVERDSGLAPALGFVATLGAELNVLACDVAETGLAGLMADGATLRVSDTTLRQSSATTESQCDGLIGLGAATILLDRCQISGFPRAGLVAAGTANVAATQLLLDHNGSAVIKAAFGAYLLTASSVHDNARQLQTATSVPLPKAPSVAGAAPLAPALTL